MSGCRHVVAFAFRDGVTTEQVDALSAALGALPGQIPEIRDYRFGPDVAVNDGNHHYAVVADFDSVDGYLAYRDHPAHQALITEHIRPIVASRAAVQFGI